MTIVDVSADDALERAATTLRAGDVVAIPTDTVYGIAVAIDVDGAPDRLFDVKRRPHDVGLPVLVANLGQALRLAIGPPDLDTAAVVLMGRFWPGPLTVVVPRASTFTVDLGGEDATVGLRCPDHAFARGLCLAVGPLVVTSANRHGEPTPQIAAGVDDAFGESLALVVDGGRCSGSPSTVVRCTGAPPVVLREGGLPWSEMVAAL